MQTEKKQNLDLRSKDWSFNSAAGVLPLTALEEEEEDVDEVTMAG